MPRIVLDFDPSQPEAPQFGADSSELVYFLSWAYSQRYGAVHELSQAALILRGELKIDILPLMTFADRRVEDPADEEALELAWQDAAPLAECCDQVARTLQSDSRFAGIREDYPRLSDNIEELGRIAAWAANRGTRIRVTYELEEG